MKKFILIYLLLVATVLGQDAIFSPTPTLSYSDKDLGTIVQGTTQADSVAITYSGKPFRVDSVKSDYLTSISIETDSVIDGSQQLYFTADISTVGTYARSLVVYGSFRGSPDTIGISYEVIPSSNVLSAPYNLVATATNDNIYISVSDSNVADTNIVISDTFDDDDWSDWSEFPTGTTTMPNEALRLTDNSALYGWLNVSQTFTVEENSWNVISVDGYIGTGNTWWLVVGDENSNTAYANYSFTSNGDTSVSFYATSSTVKVFLQGQTDDSEYVEFDNFLFTTTTDGWDSLVIHRKDYLAGIPHGDYYFLANTTDLNYADEDVIDGETFSYKAYLKKGTEVSSWSNSDTATYSLTGAAAYTVTANKEDGTYDYATIVRLESNLTGASIYYTTDGSTPTTSSDAYFKPILLENITGSQIVKTLKAFATDGDSTTSIISHAYTLNNKYNTIAVDSLTYAEAEGSFDHVGNYTVLEDDFASNGTVGVFHEYLNGIETKPYAIFSFTPQYSGTYYFWARVMSVHTASAFYIAFSTEAGSYSTIWGNSSGDGWGKVHGDSSANKGYGLYWREFDSQSLTAGTTYHYRFENAGSYTYRSKHGYVIDQVMWSIDPSYEPPEFDVLVPNGGERWSPSASKTITWQSFGTSDNVKLEYKFDHADSVWTEIISSTANDGSYAWTTPSDTGEYKIRITDVDEGSQFTESYNNFVITNNANPFDAGDNYEKYFNIAIGQSTTLADAYTNGQAQYAVEFLFNPNTTGNDDNGEWAIIPDTAKIDTFLTGNNGISKTIWYANMQTVSSQYGEGVLPRTISKDWLQMKGYGTGGVIGDSLWYTRIESSARYGLYFTGNAFINRMLERIAVYDAVYDGYSNVWGFYWDSFEPNSRFTYENDDWVDDVLGDVFLINRETLAPFTYDEWTNGFKRAGYETRRRILAAYGDGVIETWGNAQHRVTKMNDDYYMDGYCDEGFAGSNDEVVMESYYLSEHYLEYDIDNVMITLRKNQDNVLLTDRMTDVQSTDAQARFYEFCAMLLGITSPNSPVYLSTWDGTGFEDMTFMSLQRKRFVPEGRYTEIADNVFKRDFQYATVYVNNSLSTKTVNFSASYYMTDSGSWSGSTATTYDIPSMSALVISTTNTTIP